MARKTFKTQKTFKFYRYYSEFFPVKPGDIYILIEIYDEMTNQSEFSLRLDIGGVPGNVNHNILRYHGWRGTTNGVAVIAHGRRRVKFASDVYEDSYDFFQYIVVGPDLAPDEP